MLEKTGRHGNAKTIEVVKGGDMKKLALRRVCSGCGIDYIAEDVQGAVTGKCKACQK